nr:corticotropin-releasing factor receptor 2-like [Leptinotarsa decemlineata]
MCSLRIYCVLLTTITLCLASAETADPEDKCPADVAPRQCRLRESLYEYHLWNYFAGFYCYNYTNDARLLKRYKYESYAVLCRNEPKTVPVAIIDEKTSVFYDYTNSTAMHYIQRSFKSEILFKNFLTCCREAVDCCKHHMNNDNIMLNSTHCPAVWDAWSCFPPTPVGTTAKLPCSGQAYQSPDAVCRLESEKECIQNGDHADWISQTNYQTCAIAPIYRRRYNFHIKFLGTCVVFCIPAIVIFLVFEKLRKTTRVVLHRNLLIAICVRNAMTIMSKEIVLIDALKTSAYTHHIMDNNGIGCRILAFLETSSINSIYACMILDGFYLHKVIVRAFAKEIKMKHIYIALVVLTFSSSIPWAIAMAALEAKNCWMVDIHNLQWIVDGYRIVILVINTIFLMDIIRVMLLKMKHGGTTRQTMAAFRATLFLIPLFGLHILITAKKLVYDDSCAAEDLYDYARYSMESLQGILVAILFCYANKEVKNELRNAYRKLAIHLNQKYGWNIGEEAIYNNRRATTATYVGK